MFDISSCDGRIFTIDSLPDDSQGTYSIPIDIIYTNYPSDVYKYLESTLSSFFSVTVTIHITDPILSHPKLLSPCSFSIKEHTSLQCLPLSLSFDYHYPQYLNVSLISSISSFSISFIGYPWIHMSGPNTICFETSFDFEIINLYILFLLSIHRRYSFALHITDSIHPQYFNDVICSLSILDISFFTILLFIFP